jgi:hypothetical protein
LLQTPFVEIFSNFVPCGAMGHSKQRLDIFEQRSPAIALADVREKPKLNMSKHPSLTRIAFIGHSPNCH